MTTNDTTKNLKSYIAPVRRSVNDLANTILLYFPIEGAEVLTVAKVSEVQKENIRLKQENKILKNSLTILKMRVNIILFN